MTVKNLITFGCSFTEGHEMGELGSWAYHLSKKLHVNLINRGKGGASNELILNNLIGEFELNSNHIKNDSFVIIQWSECLRQSVYFNNIENDLYSRWTQITPESIHPTNSVQHNENSEFKWLESHKKSFYPFFSSAEASLHKTYSNMILAKNYLENNNIPYLFFDGINDHRLININNLLYLKGSTPKNPNFKIELNHTDYFSLNQFYLINNKIISNIYDDKFYTELNMSMNEWLYEQNQKCISQHGHDTYTNGNGGHPNDLASSEWAKLLIDYLKKIYPKIFVKSNLI